jgi:hypothetical protein
MDDIQVVDPGYTWSDGPASIWVWGGGSDDGDDE